MFKLDLEKAEEAAIKLPTSTESSKKQESSRSTEMGPKILILQMGKLRPEHLPGGHSWVRPGIWLWAARKQQLELDMKQQTGSK